MKISKRFVIALVAGVVLSGLAVLSILNKTEGVASACVAGIMTILTSYIWGETKRPSKTDKP